MYLSRLILNPLSPRVQKELANPYELHRTIMRAFPDDLSPDDERVLFRVDADRRTGIPTVLVQSLSQPDWGFLNDVPDYLLRTAPDLPNPACKAFEPQVTRGQLLRFRLRANPTFRREGKRLAWLREEDQLRWLARKAEAAGFAILRATATPEGFQDALKAHGQARLRHYAVRFDGLLRVTDPTDFVNGLARGVGPGKGLGFGLLSVAPA